MTKFNFSRQAILFAFVVSSVFQSSRSFALLGELGPVEYGVSKRLAASSEYQAFRVESYGSTTVTLGVVGNNGIFPTYFVEGPLTDNGDLVPVGTGDRLNTMGSGNLGNSNVLMSAVELKNPGVYRIVFSSRGANIADPNSSIDVSIDCTANCERKSVPMSEYLAQAQKSPDFPKVISHLEEMLKSLLPGSEFSNLLVTEFRSAVAQGEFKKLDHFPVLPLSHYEGFRDHVLANVGNASSNPPTDPVIQGKLEELLLPCLPRRKGPEPIQWLPPNLKFGHFANLALTDCQDSQSEKLASVLTALAVGNGSIQYSANGSSENTWTTPRELIAALISTGHQIEVRQERTFANFLGFTVNDQMDLRWPVWIDTGIRLQNKTLHIPSGHSQYVWRISGPLVNTRVAFFLGIHGASFFGQTDTRPGWTGRRVVWNASSMGNDAERELVLKTLDGATAYLKLNRSERATVAKKCRADGYGLLGICNDSNAFLQVFTGVSTVTFPFPLLRSDFLDSNLPVGDPVGDIMREIPDDAMTNLSGADRIATFRRILNMLPYPADSRLMFDEGLKKSIQILQTLVGRL